MLRSVALLLVTLSLTACSGAWFGERPTKRIDSYEASRVILIYSEKLKYQKHLCLEDSLIYYESHINRFRLDFSCMDSLDIWEARELLVDVVEEFLWRINRNERLRPYLSKYPMTASNLEVYITFPSYYNKFVDLQTIGMICLRGGIANYIASDALDCIQDCWHRRSEYYYQSRNFVTFRRIGEEGYKPVQSDNFGHSFGDERFYTTDLGPATHNYNLEYEKNYSWNQPKQTAQESTSSSSQDQQQSSQGSTSNEQYYGPDALYNGYQNYPYQNYYGPGTVNDNNLPGRASNLLRNSNATTNPAGRVPNQIEQGASTSSENRPTIRQGNPPTSGGIRTNIINSRR